MTPEILHTPTFRQRLSTFGAMMATELRIMSRYPVDFAASFLQMFLIIAMFAFAGMAFTARGGGAVDSGQAQTAGVVAYGFLIFLFFSDILWTIGYRVREEQTLGTLEQLYLTPASKTAALAARTVLVFTWTGLLALFSVLTLRWLFGVMPFHNGGLGMLILALTLSGAFGLGFAFAGVTLRLKETANTLVNFFQFAVLVLGAAFFPFRALPGPLQAVARFFPLSIGVDAFRSVLMGLPPGHPELWPLPVELIVVALFGLLMPPFGLAVYRWAERRARQDGSLGEY